MVELLISLLLFAIVVYVVVLIMRLIPLPEPAKQIAYIVIGLIFLVMLLDRLGLYHLALQ